MKGESKLRLMTVRLTLRKRRSTINFTWPDVGPWKHKKVNEMHWRMLEWTQKGLPLINKQRCNFKWPYFGHLQRNCSSKQMLRSHKSLTWNVCLSQYISTEMSTDLKCTVISTNQRNASWLKDQPGCIHTKSHSQSHVARYFTRKSLMLAKDAFICSKKL